MLEDIPRVEVEIRKEQVRLLMLPDDDPMLAFGENPLDDAVTDASVNHDRHLYGSREPGS